MRKLLHSMLIGSCLTVLASNVSALEIQDVRGAKIDSIVELPISGMTAIESEGQILFLSSNGRFVISGQIYDLWYKTHLDSMAQIKDVASRIDLERMGLDVTSLNTVSIGNGPEHVTIFTDPLCQYCHALVQEAMDKGLTEEYTFDLVVIPALGEKSNVLAKRLSCAKDEDAALDALLNGTLATLPIKPDCSSEVYDMTLVAAQVMEVGGVPFVIAGDGRVSRGRPANFAEWLKG